MSLQPLFVRNTAILATPYVPRPRFSSGLPYTSDIDGRVAYTETPAFRAKIEAEVAQAKGFIQQCLLRGEKGFVVLDVDETTLDNRDYYRDPQQRFYKHPTEGFYPTWETWIAEGKAPALQSTRALIDWMNEKQVPYVFVTGRIKAQHDATWRNLRRAGVTGKSCLGLYCKPNEWWIGTTESHKKEIVASLEQQWNLKALASIGDSDGDLMLMDARRNFKLSTSEFYPPRRA